MTRQFRGSSRRRARSLVVVVVSSLTVVACSSERDVAAPGDAERASAAEPTVAATTTEPTVEERSGSDETTPVADERAPGQQRGLGDLERQASDRLHQVTDRIEHAACPFRVPESLGELPSSSELRGTWFGSGRDGDDAPYIICEYAYQDLPVTSDVSSDESNCWGYHLFGVVGAVGDDLPSLTTEFPNVEEFAGQLGSIQVLSGDRFREGHLAAFALWESAEGMTAYFYGCDVGFFPSDAAAILEANIEAIVRGTASVPLS